MGCRMNLAQADALARLAPAGTTVINTCAVTAQAVRDGRTAAKRALKAGPVVVTGCAAEHAPERFADLAVRVMGNRGKLDARVWAGAPVAWDAPLAVARRARGFVAVQDGCDHRCTFCAIAAARGPSRSAGLDDVVAAVRGLVAEGCAEVVLTGVDATSWGDDLPGRPRLGALVQAVLARTAVRRLRLSSLDGAEADDALVEALGDARVMPHVHLSLQHGDDLMLKRMKRQHSRADALRLADRLRRARPDVALGADLIAGFPTEGDAAHAANLSLIADAGIVHAHVFPYSERAGTPAARMPAVPPPVRAARAAELRAAAARLRGAWLRGFVGVEVEAVSEGARGWTAHYAPVAVTAPRGAVERVRVRAVVEGVLQ